ncbi:hypothetical protein BGZ50_006481 [Haplosporangium sp. Z 11]|nr:hypothetical protein BGZ50_006481 [Haplosporangium sp. Z 11]
MGHKILAAVVSKKSNGRLQLEGKAMRERLGRVMALFLRTMEMTTEEGFELTKDDHAKGILTLSEKQESLCPCYARMEAIFTENPVFPSNSSETTKDGAIADKSSDTEVGTRSHGRDMDYGKGPKRIIADKSEEEVEEEEDFLVNDDRDNPANGDFEVDLDTGAASGSQTDAQLMVDSAAKSRNGKRPLLIVGDSNCAKRPRPPLAPVELSADTQTAPSADVQSAQPGNTDSAPAHFTQTGQPKSMLLANAPAQPSNTPLHQLAWTPKRVGPDFDEMIAEKLMIEKRKWIEEGRRRDLEIKLRTKIMIEKMKLIKVAMVNYIKPEGLKELAVAVNLDFSDISSDAFIP